MRAFRKRGDSVMLADINVEEAHRAANEDLPGSGAAIFCDLSTSDGPRSAVEAAVDRFGQLDVVFGNAGVLISAPLLAWTIDQWELTMAVNLRTPFLLAQAAVPHLMQSSNASIIYTASTGAYRGHAGMPAYGASKQDSLT